MEDGKGQGAGGRRRLPARPLVATIVARLLDFVQHVGCKDSAAKLRAKA